MDDAVVLGLDTKMDFAQLQPTKEKSDDDDDDGDDGEAQACL